MMAPDRNSMVTLLTLVFVALWVAVTVARIWVQIPQATVLDAAMPLVIGYWFVSKPAQKEEPAHE